MKDRYGKTITSALILLTFFAISGIELAHADVAVDSVHLLTRVRTNAPDVCTSCDCSDCALLICGVQLEPPKFVAHSIPDVEARLTDWSQIFPHHVRPPPND